MSDTHLSLQDCELPDYYRIALKGVTFGPLDVIEALGLGHHEACALKYIVRAGRQSHRKTDDPRGDLSKARDYLTRRLMMLEGD